MTGADVGALRHLLDRVEILDLIANAGRAIDHGDMDLLESLFLPEAPVDFGFFTGTAREFIPVMRTVAAGIGRAWHFCGQTVVKIDGNHATGDSYALSIASSETSLEPGAQSMLYAGIYRDRFERLNGKWAISERCFQLAHSLAVTDASPGDALMSIFGPLAAARG